MNNTQVTASKRQKVIDLHTYYETKVDVARVTVVTRLTRRPETTISSISKHITKFPSFSYGCVTAGLYEQIQI